MDVSVYHNWLYLVNWPEVERMDMDQYFQSIPQTGEIAGFVWHSLWNDSSDYAEEPTFIGRVLDRPGLSCGQLSIPAPQPGGQPVLRHLEDARRQFLRQCNVGLWAAQPRSEEHTSE